MAQVRTHFVISTGGHLPGHTRIPTAGDGGDLTFTDGGDDGLRPLVLLDGEPGHQDVERIQNDQGSRKNCDLSHPSRDS